MTRTVVNAELEVYAPGGSNPKTTIQDRLGPVELSERVTDMKDSGSVSILNNDGSLDAITAGDRLVFRTQLNGEPSLSDRWTGLARSPTDVLEGGSVAFRELEVVDFVFGVMSDRIAFESFEDRQIAGTSDSIVETLLAEDAPEIGRSQINTVAQTTDAFVDGRTLFSVICEDLAAIADAVVTQDGTDIIFRPLEDVTADVGLTPDDFYAPINIERNDDNLKNQIRVVGGTDHAVDDKQEAQSSLQTVTKTNRITQQIQSRKSEVARVSIYTGGDPNGDSLRVRVQATRSGQPVAIDDTSSDIARRELAPEFLANNGFTEFLLPNNSVAPAENPTIIVEATGPTGQPVGVDANGNLTFRSEYPFPLLTRALDQQSIDTYRRRDRRLEDDSLETFASVRDKANSVLRRSAQPELTVEADARTLAAHNVSPGEAVTLSEFGVSDANGDHIVRERTSEYGGTQLRTTLLLQKADTL